jgi:alkylation response protein AidB-like acyl-CoA dehydrogenase
MQGGLPDDQRNDDVLRHRSRSRARGLSGHPVEDPPIRPRDVRLMRLYEGTSEIQRLTIGRGLIKAARTSG